MKLGGVDLETFGAILRKSKNLTLDELVEKINSTSSTLSRYENDQRVPDLVILESLANYLNVSIDYLLGRENITLESIIAESGSEALKSNLYIKKNSWIGG